MNWFTFFCLVVFLSGPTARADDAPRAADRRLEVVRFAQSPQIRQPISIDFDRCGRLLAIESHTHFRPAGYQGPEHDRILALEDVDGDGGADRFRTFFEGTKHTMDLAVHHDGSVYVATRNEILRLEDANDDGIAERSQRIVSLETKGDYPHNGLSGLAFDFDGNLVFGMGENLGAAYRLVGADGTTIAGEGEGGNIFGCTQYGQQLHAIATGFWNPFGVTIDIFGRMWAVDNDPDAMPPCRLLHVVEGGDYGYQFRYGRSGRHPFQAWNGQLPGTLPMASGTGEAPCEVLAYESDGLPEDYLGNLLVTSWADHRVERYTLKPRGASYEAQRQPFVQGGGDFRPVGLAMAPDGSLFLSDWVRSDYNLHNQGSIWHIRRRESVAKTNRVDPSRPLSIKHRPTREAAARRLHELHKSPVRLLCDQLHSDDLRVRATAVAIMNPACREEARALIAGDPEDALRAYAVQKLALRREQGSESWLGADQSAAVRLAAVASLGKTSDAPRLVQLLEDEDPFLRSAAVRQLSRLPQPLVGIDIGKLSPRARMGILLAERSAAGDGSETVGRWLDDLNEEVRFLAVKWIADRRLTELRPRVVAALNGHALTVRMYEAYATALARIDGEEVSEAKMADHFIVLAADDRLPAERRAAALRLVPASNQRLTIDLLRRLATSGDERLRLEAVRALAENPQPERFVVLEELARDESLCDQLRAEALIGLASKRPAPVALFMRLAKGDRETLRAEAIRGLTGEPLPEEPRDMLSELATQHPDSEAIIARVLGKPSLVRPPHDDLQAWLNRLEGPADADAGRRVFFHPKLAGCYRCHRVDGRGREVGPDLSVIGRAERRHLLESLLQPSTLVAPHYQVWHLELADGRSLTGMLVRTYLDEYSYVDPQGNLFKVRTTDIATSRPAPQSIMPAGMADRLTDQELRDLLAFLGSR